MYNFIISQARLGKQSYIVCPLIQDDTDSDEVAPKSAEALYSELSKGVFRDMRLGLIHGRMSGADKESVLTDFSSGNIDILIATTVIEVGVNVPNAVIMVIENADRFGLAQLHQLRGRVGRSAEQSWCFLLAEPNERLRILTRTSDGFEIARKDMELRGAGELYGLKQHGMAYDLIAGADSALLEETQKLLRALREDHALADEARHVFISAKKRFPDAAVLSKALN